METNMWVPSGTQSLYHEEGRQKDAYPF